MRSPGVNVAVDEPPVFHQLEERIPQCLALWAPIQNG